MNIIRDFEYPMMDDPKILVIESLLKRCVKANIVTKEGADALRTEINNYAF